MSLILYINKILSSLRLLPFIAVGLLASPTFIMAAAQPVPTYLSSVTVQKKMQEVFDKHCLYHALSEELVERQLLGIFEQLDHSHTCFIESEISNWIAPKPEFVQQLKAAWSKGDFSELDRISQLFVKTLERRKTLLAEIQAESTALKTKQPQEAQTVANRELLKEEKWPADLSKLRLRLTQLVRLEQEIIEGVAPERRSLIAQRIAQRRKDFEEPFLSKDSSRRKHEMFQVYLHAFADSFDAHTRYLTPDEARSVSNHIQRKITGIGVVLREELEGYRIVRIIEGSPAAIDGHLQLNDHIVAVEGEPTPGLDLNKGVLLIQGVKGSSVRLTLQRNEKIGHAPHTFELQLNRDEIVLKENRYRILEEPFGAGIIATIELYSFYDGGGADLRREIEQLQAGGKLEAIILDLRHNGGGLLPQSVELCGLFLHPGIVVSARMPGGQLSHLRLIEDRPVWKGPLVVLVSQASASCSEIVTGTLQDWGRALIVGDPHTSGKGSFQLFTLKADEPDPYGVFTITQGIYYTVSGRSPQLTGIVPDICVAGPLAALEIGEQTLKYPLPKQSIEPCFEDALEDASYFEQQWLKRSYLPKLHKPQTFPLWMTDQLRANSKARLCVKSNHEIGPALETEEISEPLANDQDDAQLRECLNIVKDWLYLECSASELQAI